MLQNVQDQDGKATWQTKPDSRTQNKKMCCKASVCICMSESHETCHMSYSVFCIWSHSCTYCSFKIGLSKICIFCTLISKEDVNCYIKINTRTLFLEKKDILLRLIEVHVQPLFFMRQTNISRSGHWKIIILLFCPFKHTYKFNTLTGILLFTLCWKPINKTLYTGNNLILTERNVEDALVSQLKLHITFSHKKQTDKQNSVLRMLRSFRQKWSLHLISRSQF